MFLVIEENENCEGQERVFSESGPKKEVTQLNVDPPQGEAAWFEVTGLNENGEVCPAYAVQVEDSGAGTAMLIYGGDWGIRFRDPNKKEEWSLANKNQWGEPFKVLDSSGVDIKYK